MIRIFLLIPSNPGMAYNIGGDRNCTTLIGCYSESDLRPSFLQDLGIAIGGEHGANVGLHPGYHAGFSPDSRGLRIRGAGYVTPMTVVKELAVGDQVVSKDELQLGYAQGTAIFGWRRNRYLPEQERPNPDIVWTNPDEFRLRYDDDTEGRNWWELLRTADTYLRFIERNAITDPVTNPIITFPLGYRLGSPNMTEQRIMIGEVPIQDPLPQAGPSDNIGDRVYNNNPTLGNYIGKVCAAAPPTSNNKVWKRFGLIDST